MLDNTKERIKNVCLSAGMIVVFVTAAVFAVIAQTEPEKKPATNTNASKENYIEVVGKVLSIDPIKGDVTVRLEFEPKGSFTKEDGTLSRTLKLDINSSNGKQEITFDKGKRLTPTEAVLNMYDGNVTDYPFDKHEADLMFFFTVKPDKPADKPKPAETKEDPAAKTADEKPATENKPAPAEADDDEIEVPISLEFVPTMPGFKIESAKNKESDETYVDITMKISRSPMVVFFSIFVMILMWAVSIAVLFLVLSVVVRGRKVEIAMFSFIATLLFAFVAVRNSQPGVPPIGTFTDYSSFFWAEVILALSLLTILFTWLLRPAAK
jgi:hypothetical protein